MRVLGSAASSRELAVLGVPSAFQLVPLLVEYHHVPLLASATVTAMPCSAPRSASLTPPTSALTSVPTAPLGALASSFTAFSVTTVSASTGAVLTMQLTPNSEVFPLGSVAVAVTRSPTARPLTVSAPLKLPLASAVRNPR